MNTETLNFPTESGKPRNNSTLSYADCCMRLTDWSRPFEKLGKDVVRQVCEQAINEAVLK